MTSVSRRSFMCTAAAASCAAATGALAAAARRHRFFAGHDLPIGLQLYTLGDAPDQDLEETLQAVAKIGYRTVEGVGYMKHTAAQFRAALDRAGLSCPSTHVPLAADSGGGPSLADDIGALAADMHRLGVKYVVVPMLAVPQRLGPQRAGEDGSAYWGRVSREMTADDWQHVAAQLNEKGAALKREGLKLGYHNHNPELTRLGSKTALDLLIENTDPGLVWFEMDAGWIAAGGAEPIPVLRAHPHRFRLMHIKDLKASTVANAALNMDPANVGSGSLDWKAILPVAYEVGVRYYYVEQEPPFVGSRMQAARADYDFLARLS
jgi:sugar phosphate isomerase/epimerase